MKSPLIPLFHVGIHPPYPLVPRGGYIPHTPWFHDWTSGVESLCQNIFSTVEIIFYGNLWAPPRGTGGMGGCIPHVEPGGYGDGIPLLKFILLYSYDDFRFIFIIYVWIFSQIEITITLCKHFTWHD